MKLAITGSLRRFRTVFLESFAYQARRPLFIIWAVILGLTAWGMSTGTMMIRSGDATVGGTKAYVTSEFAVAMQLSAVTLLFSGFFVAVCAGMVVIQDEQWRIGELLHSTSLRPSEYIWAKFAAVLSACAAILLFQLAAMMVSNHILPNSEAHEIRGPFQLINYFRPALVFALPTVILLAGVAFALGEWTRRPVLVFLWPVVVLAAAAFFLWDWSPNWLDPRINDILMWIDPAGFRWLNETWLKVDRGVAFYNQRSIPIDRDFLTSRVLMVAIGFGAVALCPRHFGRALRGVRSRRTEGSAVSDLAQPAVTAGPLPRPAMTASRPGLLTGAWHVARVELAELRASPGLYLFIPLVLLQTIGTSFLEVGFLDTPLLVTPGTFAIRTMGTLAFWLCVLLMFYLVESLERESATGLASIAYAAPVRSGSFFLGKGVAIVVVGLAVTLAVALAGVIILLIQRTVPVALGPFLFVWGFLLLPTLVAWTALVMAIHTITHNRYSTYALALGVLCFTGYRLLTEQINWVGNWPVWSAVRWSDLSALELDRKALVLSRLLAMSAGVLLFALSLACFRRRAWDATRVVHRLSPRALGIAALRLLPWAVVPVFLAIWLALEVSWGYEGGAAKKEEKDYWRKNLATYLDARVPDIKHVELELELFPDRGRYRVKGSYDLHTDARPPLAEILLTAGPHWEKLSWTVDGKPSSPTNRAGLFVFTPTVPLSPGKSIRIGFEHEGSVPRGISKKGGGTPEFILPSSVVLTSFRPTIVPVLGYVESEGIDDDNRHDAKDYQDDFFEGRTDSFVGSRAPYTTHIRITGPAAFTLNSVGTKTMDAVADGRRTVVWESDHPVSFFNVVAGRWQVERGEGTAVYYHAAHSYNIAEMRQSLDAARRYYSQWFYPYPWRELKLSEFAGVATYAQGFPTDITFSEAIGFLTKSNPEIHAAFEITAHEAAHQWWGNILTPGKGPGGNILAEGTAHFSTILLIEQALGQAARIDFCKRIEASYAKDRQADSERPLVKITGERPGDTTVTYDKGGWVFWMLLDHMGRDRALAGIRAFIKAYHGNPDHPVLQDFLRSMRPFAADPPAFDRFTRQWFHEVVVPEYRLESPVKTALGDRWKTRVRITNVGTGTMPVEIAATRGQRFRSDGSPSTDFREARETVTIRGAESCDVSITAPFDPERLVVDPDAKVMQLRRKSATVAF